MKCCKEEIVSKEVIQQNLENFVKILPGFIEGWRNAIQESVKPIDALCNESEQLRCVEKANIIHMESFKETQSSLQFHILSGIEEEIGTLRILVEKLSKLNQTTRNKLFILEKSTVNLDWDDDSRLLKGSATQPSLSILLQHSLEFWTFFACAFKKISESLKSLDVRDEKSVGALKNNFNVDLNHAHARYLLAITQYINNEKALV